MLDNYSLRRCALCRSSKMSRTNTYKSKKVDHKPEIYFSRREPLTPRTMFEEDLERKEKQAQVPSRSPSPHQRKRTMSVAPADLQHPIIPQHTYDPDNNELSPGQAPISAESKQPESESDYGESSNEFMSIRISEPTERGMSAIYISDSMCDSPFSKRLAPARESRDLSVPAGMSSVAYSEARSPAKDAERVETSAAGLRYDHMDYDAPDDEDGSPQEVEPPVTRPESPDIVDNLLAEWTTLPR